MQKIDLKLRNNAEEYVKIDLKYEENCQKSSKIDQTSRISVV